MVPRLLLLQTRAALVAFLPNAALLVSLEARSSTTGNETASS